MKQKIPQYPNTDEGVGISARCARAAPELRHVAESEYPEIKLNEI